MPKRIQMTRQRPWRPEYPDAVIVDRTTKWGNPFRIRQDDDRRWTIVEDEIVVEVADSRDHAQELAVELFRLAVHPAAPSDSHPDYPFVRDMERELRGRDLACWCSLDQPCHADVLIEFANGPTHV